MSTNVGSWVLVGVIALLQVGGAAAQDAASVPVVQLLEAEAVFPEPFSNIGGVRELADGRVVVADRLEVAVRILDFESGGLQEIGGEGRGPGEFRQPGALLGLPGDSTLLVDYGNMQMLAIAPDGRFVEIGPMMRSEGIFVRPTGTDARGRIYFEMLEIGAGPASAPPDSQRIVRWDRETGAIDTVATTGVVTSLPRSFRASGGNVSFGGGKMPAYPAADGWGVAPDGRVAVARAVEYHLEWWPGSGAATVGPIVDYAPVPVSEEDKQARVEQGAGGVAVMMVQGGGGGGGGGGRTVNLPQPEIDDFEWPEVKPAFPRNAVTVAPDGEAWVRRHVAHGEPETHDVFDATGRRVRQVILPAGRRLVGFGGDTAYAIYTDDDDLQWLERYRR